MLPPNLLELPRDYYMRHGLADGCFLAVIELIRFRSASSIVPWHVRRNAQAQDFEQDRLPLVPDVWQSGAPSLV